ncbi:TSUP family transporter [Longitalea luteola]|uniref:TSUP family transporter n=1 Tax=Longitalea luteola TaxID=2812563 RepID=UPI001A9765F2|nr:TSUP family transporter [Longitalea luteola]
MSTEQKIPVKQTAVASADQGNLLFPVFLKLEELKVLLVGGGKVGLEKLSALLGNSPAAPVTVVAKSISDEVRRLAKHHPNVTLHERAFQEADLENKDLVVIAVNEKESSQAIRAAAKERKILVNVADTPEQCDFYLSSIVQKGNLKIAISTNGKSPTAAKRIKEVLNHALPNELDDMINNLHAVRNKLNGNFEYKVKRLNELTRILVEKDNVERERRWRKIATYSLVAFGLMLIGHFIFSYLPFQRIADDTVKWYQQLDKNFHWMLLAGFLAQVVDGALGMGYGVTSATILLSAGVSPAAMSGSIHTAEMFASGASGYSHYKFGNVNKKLFKALVIPGVLGAVLGAYLLYKLTKVGLNADYVRPVVACYTMLLGLRILWNAFKNEKIKKKFKHYGWLAGIGGFLDSFGGGGWGPIVTTTLITKGRSPRFVIGSVSLTEFFVTLASAFTFFTLMGLEHWQVIVALVIGGLLAAPLAAKLAGKLPRKTSLILLGLLVIFWSLRIIVKIF